MMHLILRDFLKMSKSKDVNQVKGQGKRGSKMRKRRTSREKSTKGLSMWREHIEKGRQEAPTLKMGCTPGRPLQMSFLKLRYAFQKLDTNSTNQYQVRIKIPTKKTFFFCFLLLLLLFPSIKIIKTLIYSKHDKHF